MTFNFRNQFLFIVFPSVERPLQKFCATSSSKKIMTIKGNFSLKKKRKIGKKTTKY